MRGFLGRPSLGGMLTICNLVAVGLIFLIPSILGSRVPEGIVSIALVLLISPIGWLGMPGLGPPSVPVFVAAIVANAFLWGYGFAGIYYQMGGQHPESEEERRIRNLQCPVCGYDLRGSLGSKACSECGTSIPADVRRIARLKALEEDEAQRRSTTSSDGVAEAKESRRSGSGG